MLVKEHFGCEIFGGTTKRIREFVGPEVGL